MARFLIEVPHDNTEEACNRAVQIFKATGSHFVTNAEWGCHDNEHKAWMIVDLDDKEQARSILPHEFRSVAKITRVEHLSRENIDTIAKDHNA